MTDDQLDTLELLWRNNIPVKRIAYMMGYCEGTIYHNLKKYRDRFPRRRHDPNPSHKELMVERVIAGRISIKEAAQKLGIHYEAMRKAVRDREQEAGMAKADRTVQEV